MSIFLKPDGSPKLTISVFKSKGVCATCGLEGDVYKRRDNTFYCSDCADQQVGVEHIAVYCTFFK